MFSVLFGGQGKGQGRVQQHRQNCGVAAKARRKGHTDHEDWPWAVIVGKPKEASFQVLKNVYSKCLFKFSEFITYRVFKRPLILTSE